MVGEKAHRSPHERLVLDVLEAGSAGQLCKGPGIDLLLVVLMPGLR